VVKGGREYEVGILKKLRGAESSETGRDVNGEARRGPWGGVGSQ